MTHSVQMGDIRLSRWESLDDAHAAVAGGLSHVTVSNPRGGGAWCGVSHLPSDLGGESWLVVETDFHGIEPRLLATGSSVLLGTGGYVYWLRPGDMEPVGYLDLGAPFYDFLLIEAPDRVLVVHEIGFVLLDRNDQVWNCGFPDIVASWRISGGGIELTLFEGGMWWLDLGTGRATKRDAMT